MIFSTYDIGLGAASEQQLNAIGVYTKKDLEKIGALEAYIRMKEPLLVRLPKIIYLRCNSTLKNLSTMVYNYLKIYCLSVHSFFLVSFTSMYTTLKIISRKFHI
jgi:hypothetical protein